MATNILSAVNDITRLADFTASANAEIAQRALDLAAKKELVSIAGAINTAAAKGLTSINYNLSNTISSLTGINADYAINLIEEDMDSARYYFKRIKNNKSMLSGYTIEWNTIINVEDIASAVSSLENVSDATLVFDGVELNISQDTQIIAGPNKRIIVDVNDATITNDLPNNRDTGAFIADGGTLIIKGNGTISGTGRAVIAKNGGNVVIEGGTFTCTGSAGEFILAIGEGSTITINDAHMSASEMVVRPMNGATININGGYYTASDNAVLATNGLAGTGNNIFNIRNCEIVGQTTSANYEGCGIYVANNDIVNISNTSIDVTNGCGILLRGGKVNISNSSIDLHIEEGFTGGWVGDNKYRLSTSGIIYHEAANYPGKDNLELVVGDGVTINADAHSIEVISNEELPKVSVSRKGSYNPPYPEPAAG